MAAAAVVGGKNDFVSSPKGQVNETDKHFGAVSAIESSADSLLDDEDDEEIGAATGNIPFEVKPRIILMGLKR